MHKILMLLSFIGISACDIVEVNDYSKITYGVVTGIATPQSITELQTIVKNNPTIAIAGANYSMGGQTWCNNGLVIDMKHFNRIITVDIFKKTITVQTGARWKEIQEFLHQYNLTVKVMQSYNNFSVGGSLSVNVHGRDPYGSLITTVKSLRIILSNGSIVQTSRTERPELFSAVIGGYGACGVILDVTLELEDNFKIKRVVTSTPITDFAHVYKTTIADDPNLAFFNGNLYPPHFDRVVNFCWYKTNDPLTNCNLAQHHTSNFVKDSVNKNLEFSAVHIPSTQKVRRKADTQLSHKTEVVWRSHEMSHSINALAPHWMYASKILQEYFVPVEHFDRFVQMMKKIITENNVKMLNISIRYVHKNNESLLTYAPTDCFAFVCYIVLYRTSTDISHTKQWTQKLIDAALSCDGSYYLPYHLFARPDQLIQAYPHYPEFLKIKQKYDATGKFQNNLLQTFENSVETNA